MSAPTGLAVSVQTRLVRHAKAIDMDPNLVLARFAIERFLYRLSRSPSSIRVTPIRLEDPYGGLRATVQALLGKARLRVQVQVDVGIGDAVTPEPEWLDYPGLLDFPRARMRAYRPETVISGKLHAMATLGATNSRMRDFFDVYALSERKRFEGVLLARAVRATFERRRTAIPNPLPLALTPEFAAMLEKQSQWRGFLRKDGLTSAPADLGQTIERVAIFLEPVIAAARRDAPLTLVWSPGGPWTRMESKGGGEPGG